MMLEICLLLLLMFSLTSTGNYIEIIDDNTNDVRNFLNYNSILENVLSSKYCLDIVSTF
jgi:hypothetical protein